MQKIYERPDGKQILKNLKQKHPQKSHPRILIDKEELEKLKTYVKVNPFMIQRWKEIKKAADEALEKEPQGYIKQKHRLLQSCRIALRTMQHLALSYLLTGNEIYAKRLWEEVYNCCIVWPDWNNYHFLDTGELTLGIAVAYDWLYAYWDNEQKKIMEDAILDRAIKGIMEDYLDLPRSRAHGAVPNSKYKSWIGHNNWSFVCSGGVSAGALAICDEKQEYEEACGTMLSMGIQEVEGVLSTYAPDGGYIEGISYWDYGNTYLAYYAKCLLSATGSDYGILKSPGLEQTAFFIFDMLGPGGSFNFSDCTGISISPACLWFAKYYNRPELVDMYRETSEIAIRGDDYAIRELLFYTPEMENQNCIRALDSYYRRAETVTIRNSWNTENGFFIGLHAGENGIPHFHMDCGSFIFDMNGKRFALDLGKGTYNEEGGFYRYRYSAQGHNTWVINPAEGLTQNVEALTTIIAHSFGNESSFAIADITDAYRDEVELLHRGILATEGKQVFLVQDELKACEPIEAYWQMHTEAEIEILKGGKQALLSLGEDQVLVTLLTNNSAVFEVHESMPYKGTPYYPVSDSDEHTSKLILHFKSIIDERVAVEFRHLFKGEKMPDNHLKVTDLKSWAI